MLLSNCLVQNSNSDDLNLLLLFLDVLLFVVLRSTRGVKDGAVG